MEKKSRKTRKQTQTASTDSSDVKEKSEQCSQMLSAIKQFFDSHDLPYDEPIIDVKEDGTLYFYIRARFDHATGSFKMSIMNAADGTCLLFYASSPLRVPAKRRQAISEFITRTNYGQVIGNLEMDFSDGEVLFKTCLDCEGTVLTDELIFGLLFGSYHGMGKYQPLIESVIIGEATPEQADENSRSTEQKK